LTKSVISSNINFYYINLDRAHERNKHFLEQYTSANLPFNKLKRFSALDGKTYNFSDEEIKMFDNCDYYYLDYKKNIMGNQLSHYYIFKDIIKNNYAFSVIFQDDAVLKNNFKTHLNNIIVNLPADTEILNIGFHKYACNEKFIPWDLSSDNDSEISKCHLNEYICKIKNKINPCSLAYIITLKGAINLINYFDKTTFKRATDYNFNDYLISNDINYGSNIVLVTGNPGFKSDIF
jgi:GR25 family glycosyltransferase involved in LPS biosynthesis